MPPHVPVVFLDAGASGMFSAFCKEQLAKADLTEDDFGGYDHVKRRCDAAKREAQAVQNGTRTTPLTPNERMLAQSSASHLQQDALFRQGLGRFDPCATLVPGYDGRRAPAMPLMGGGNQTGTEEGMMQAHEQQSIANRGLQPGDTYPRGQMGADADARLRTIPRLQDQCPPTTSAPQGSGQAPPGTSPGGSPSLAAGVQGSTPNVAASGPTAAIDGSDLVECINNFRKLAEQQMIQDCIDRKDAYHDEACGNFHGGGTPAATPTEYRAQQQAQLDRIPDTPANRGRRAKVQDRINRSNNAECRYNDAQRLTGGLPNPNPQGNGTIPPAWSPSPGASGAANSGSIS
jgi:hypothetical protein